MIWNHITVNVTLDTLEKSVLVLVSVLHILTRTLTTEESVMYVIWCVYVIVDINECAGDHGCHHLCNNTDGSFHCYCNPGYILDSNGTTCTGWSQ